MKDENVWDYSHCNIGHPCSNCDDTCSFRKEVKMKEFPCDNCEIHMCGYCTLKEKWNKEHPKPENQELKKYDWD
jgi:hypothetical protein